MTDDTNLSRTNSNQSDASLPLDTEALSRSESEGGMPVPEASGSAHNPPHAWKAIVARYQKSSNGRAIGQVLNTLLPYAGLWFLMYLVHSWSMWLAVPLAIVAGGFLVRTFIIFHDCGHGSFFKSQRANHILGTITGILTFTPYYHWRWEHAIHHSSSGDLDRRGTGDMWTLTVREYLELSRWKRFAYRLSRNPFVLFVVAPLFLLFVKHRLPAAKAPRRERLSVHLTNLAVLLLAIGLSSLFGFKAFLLLQIIAAGVAYSAGVWLFYVQHQFEGVYWGRGDSWDYTAAALQGSSFYKLPKILQWFSGNIGFHHIHHLSPRIPNYQLEKCHEAEPMFQAIKPVTLLASFKSFTMHLWDEQRQKLVGYRQLRLMLKQQKRGLTP
ncbi:MAG TPA: fatty acid desaturase [Candidatus Saccharimonadales bacterium]|nr:fatty acid desaturase [Candidatus Saccharimonadales bacterium]